MAKGMDTQSVNAFSDELKSAFQAGYRDGFNGVPDGEKIARALNAFPILKQVYLLGYEAGRQDANDKGEWNDRGKWSDLNGE